MNLRIDLHAHSSVSDGTEPPYELVRLARQAGLDVVAITDHDTVAGWSEATEAAQELGMGLIPGLELSTKRLHSVHIVSYLVNPVDKPLNAELERIRSQRVSRARTIVENIATDYAFSWEQVAEFVVDGATVGRPHIADALVKAGYASDRSEAFAEILHPSKGYTIPIYAPSPAEGIALIRQAGGVPVLAHPGTSRHGRVIPQEELAKLVDAGLFGLEINHPENLAQNRAQLLEYAKYFNLEITGSSDWHGTGKINRLGEQTTDPRVLEKILEQGHAEFAVLHQG